ncbi:MAG: hypothetical protein IJD41_00315 [Alphaproteobacteria bacterium]|nr:hypothetical protein [Alphaproteobacteria bacterium]MBQ7127698.1 hypothetical protein [Alphaproteobacteria bacterium]
MKKICFTVLLLFAFTAPGYAEICGVGYYIAADGTCAECDIGTYNDVPDATECKQCPEDTTQYQDSCDISYGEENCIIGYNSPFDRIERCQLSYISRFFAPDQDHDYYVIIDTVFDSRGSITKYTRICDAVNYEPVDYATMEEALNGECVKLDAIDPNNIPDGAICMDVGNETPMCIWCSFFHSLFTHSYGARTVVTDCYGYSNAGYYYYIDETSGDVMEAECASGNYCPGGIEIRAGIDESGHSTLSNSGALACSALPGEHDVSPENATSAPGAINPTDCYVDVGGGESVTVKDEYGTYTSVSGMCYYTID